MARKNRSKNVEEERVTLEAIDAMSSDEDDEVDEEEMNAEAEALRQVIKDGAFDKLLQRKSNNDEEAEIDEDDSEANDDDASSDDDESESEEKEQVLVKNSKALATVLDEMTAAKRGMPWAETFDVIPADPLPFEDNPLDVHDDLKREVAFYNLALEAVKEARNACNDAGVPFSRPDDFFAEMVKTDDHMAKVKDRLIFEAKKMDAVAQRKSNKEQKLRAKEKRANKVAEKAKRKKDHFKAVDEWAKTAASNRGGALVDDDDEHFNGQNKKRMSADRKYGHGGKRGRFKQNDRKSLDDMSGFNPRGNFHGGSKSKKGSGANRKGKRARDAARSK
eukprot:CAMPEP_0202497490 /NCGR_PEP_ID=MMETSP1361-20130828/22979_1 /ASSEMBLY_ACC=CAM_ASM_000849 /TAXON_ID=210615 /ORGANISM="Staurosira complex sp., Strain CCMP2646" /LENGTH=333 /DNA_ID=CAMNT_0049129103 /DNA_START=6 /DNA_END=1007 /DNA_ORIENTATION=+